MAIFDSGTKTIFHQTSAPTGWTKESVNYENHALRIVNGSSLSSGGSVDFTTGFSTTVHNFSGVSVPYTVGDTTLSASMLPFHNHPVQGPSLYKAIQHPATFSIAGSPSPFTSVINPASSPNNASGTLVGGSGAHNHLMTITATGNVFSPNSTLFVNYIDVIIASLD